MVRESASGFVMYRKSATLGWFILFNDSVCYIA